MLQDLWIFSPSPRAAGRGIRSAVGVASATEYTALTTSTSSAPDTGNAQRARLQSTINRYRGTRQGFAVLLMELKALTSHGTSQDGLIANLRAGLRRREVDRFDAARLLILLSNINDMERVDLVVARLQRLIRDTLRCTETDIQPRLMIGRALYPRDGIDPKTLIQIANTYWQSQRHQS